MLSFPTLRNPSKIRRAMLWRSLHQESVSGERSNVNLFSYPRRRYTITYDVMYTADSTYDWQQIEGFYNLVKGAATVWSYTDFWDNTTTNEQFGVGTGALTQFQLIRTFGRYSEMVTVVNTINQITINGTPTAAYTVGATGLITFNTPPASLAVLRWTGTYNWACRFDDDNFDFDNAMYYYFQLGGLTFSTEKLL